MVTLTLEAWGELVKAAREADDLMGRAKAAGLWRTRAGYRDAHVGWGRPDSDRWVVGRADSGAWWFIPEHMMPVALRYYPTEAEALAAALLWRESVVLS